MRDNLLPIIFFLFMFVNIYLDRLKRKRRRVERRQEEQNELPPEQQEPEKRPRVQLKHKALVNGFIMSQVLDKPRALKPYEEIQ